MKVLNNYKPAHANINFHGALGVDGKALVRIDGNTEETWVSVDQLILIPDHRVPQDTGIIEISQAKKNVRDFSGISYCRSVGSHKQQ